MNRVFLGLGSNVGNRIYYLLEALNKINEEIGKLIKVSTIYESEPWGVKDQRSFLNCVAEIKTPLCPRTLLKKVKILEKKLGRRNRFRWGPREIDIDILLFEDRKVSLRDLEIPHPRIKERDFVLVPLVEIAPSLIDPETGLPYFKFLGFVNTYLKPFCCIRAFSP